MVNPLRRWVMRRFEARLLLRLGGPLGDRSRALEIGSGAGFGAEQISALFGATQIDSFDLDPRMARLASRHCERHDVPARFWVGDASCAALRSNSYDAVFCFGVLHHVEAWRRAVADAHRVLKPGGRFYLEEPLRRLIEHPLLRKLLEHPSVDRFDYAALERQLTAVGFEVSDASRWGDLFAWVVARKRPALSALSGEKGEGLGSSSANGPARPTSWLARTWPVKPSRASLVPPLGSFSLRRAIPKGSAFRLFGRRGRT